MNNTLEEFNRAYSEKEQWAREQIRKMLSQSGEAIGNGDHDYSIIEMVEKLIQSKNYFIKKSDSVERERDETRKQLRIAVGLLSTHPQFANKHPEDVLAFVKEGAK